MSERVTCQHLDIWRKEVRCGGSGFQTPGEISASNLPECSPRRMQLRGSSTFKRARCHFRRERITYYTHHVPRPTPCNTLGPRSQQVADEDSCPYSAVLAIDGPFASARGLHHMLSCFGWWDTVRTL